MDKGNRFQSGYGAIFDNLHKKQPNHPDFRGTITLKREEVEGLLDAARGNLIEVEASGWWKKDRNNKEFISISLGGAKERE